VSVKVQGLVWDHYPVGGGELNLALKLADHADHEGNRIWPSVAAMAAYTRQSKRQVQRQLLKMRDRGWLQAVRAGGAGAGQTTRYRIPVAEITQQLVGKGDKMSPIHLGGELRPKPEPNKGDICDTTGPKPAEPRVTSETNKGDVCDIKGDIAMTPEPSLLQPSKNHQVPARLRAPGPAVEAINAYSAAITERYGVPPKPNAKTNAHLKAVVSRVGAEDAVAVVRAFVAGQDPFHVKRGHRTEDLLRDCEQIDLALRRRAGSKSTPTLASITLIRINEGGTEAGRQIDDCPPGDPEQIARKALGTYGRMVASWHAKYIDVSMGERRTRFSVEELRVQA